MLQGFKEFVMRGNALELAVGVVIAGAFSAIVRKRNKQAKAKSSKN